MFMRKTRLFARAARLLIILSVIVPAVGMVSAQDVNAFTITVVGVGSAVGIPDMATLDIGVEQVGTDLDKISGEVNQRIDDITAALVDLEIAAQDIQHTSLDILPQDITDSTTGVATGELLYHVTSSLSVIIRDVTQTQPVINAAITSGANRINNLRMGLNDSSALEQEARVAAVANAYQRAQALAAGLNLVLGDPITVEETIDNNGMPVPLAASSAAGTVYISSTEPASTSPLVMTVRLNVIFRTRSRSGS